MENTWNLNKIYKGFESEEFLNDIKFLNDLSAKINANTQIDFKSKSDAITKIENYISSTCKITDKIIRLSVFCSLKISENSKNSTAVAYQGKVANLRNLFNPAKLSFKKYLLEFTPEEIDNIINSSDLLKNHEFYLKEIISKEDYALSDAEEILLSNMQITGSSAWSRLQGNTAANATMKVEIDGKTIEIPVTAKSQLPKAKSKDEKYSRFLAECEAYKNHATISSECLNNIKGEVITVANARSYASPLDMTLKNCRMSEKTLNALIESIEEYLPKLRKYYKIKADILGYENGLPFYEIASTVGNSTMKFTIEGAKKEVIEAYHTFSNELGDFADNAFKEEWVDFLPRVGKRSGAFCSSCHAIGESRVLTNFNGNFKDINTLAHELGHGFHGKQLASESVFNCSYPMPLAETASTFCEEILKQNLINKIDADNMLSFLDFSILSPTQVTVDILSRFYFEKEFFEIRKDHQLSVEEINEIMLKSQKKAYGDSIDEKTFNPYMWLNKVHYYYASRNFYNFPYAFGLLFSLGLHAIYEEKGESFTQDYNKLLKATGKMSIKDVCKIVDIDCESKEFWKKSLDKIVNKIDQFEKMSK